MSGVIESIGEFHASSESWEAYIERFLVMKTILLRHLCTPVKTSSKNYVDLVKFIKDYFYPKHNEIRLARDNSLWETPLRNMWLP